MRENYKVSTHASLFSLLSQEKETPKQQKNQYLTHFYFDKLPGMTFLSDLSQTCSQEEPDPVNRLPWGLEQSF